MLGFRYRRLFSCWTFGNFWFGLFFLMFCTVTLLPLLPVLLFVSVFNVDNQSNNEENHSNYNGCKHNKRLPAGSPKGCMLYNAGLYYQ